MANETRTNEVTNLINSELIDPMVADYALDATVLAPAVRERNLAGLATKTATFEKWNKTSAVAIGELSATTNTAALGTSEVSVSVSKIGIRRQLTEEALATTILGEGGLEEFVAEDAGKLIGELIETNLWALFSSATTSVSHSGLAFSVSYFVEMMAKQRVAKAPGPWSVFLAAKQTEHLSQSVVNSGSSVFGNSAGNAQGILAPSENGYLGPLFGLRCWYSNLNTTSGSDVVGACITDARGNERQSPIGFAMLWEFKTMVIPSSDVSYIYIIHSCVGQGLINTDTITKVVTSGT